MREEMESLNQRISRLQRWIVGLALCCAAATMFSLLAITGQAANAGPQPDTLTVKRLAIVDSRGVERVVLAAPLPDPLIQGRRVHRDGPVSGILIFDPKGNERGGFVISDTGDMAAFLTLDSEHDQVFTAYANAEGGATVWAANENHDAIAFSTHKQPVLEIIQNKKVIYKEPTTTPDLHQ